MPPRSSRSATILRSRAVDIVGTGGDRSHSINVSTMAAIVVAGAGVPVCKHGARAASSQCGAADVLEELGVAIELSPEAVLRCIEEVGIGFCLAPKFHPAFRFAAPSRREIGIATVSTCSARWPTPAGSPPVDRRRQPGSCRTDAGLVAPARFRAGLGRARRRARRTDDHRHRRRCWHSTTTTCARSRSIPVALGFAPAIPDELVGGTPPHNAEVVRRVMKGEHGAHRNIVVAQRCGGSWSLPASPIRWKTESSWRRHRSTKVTLLVPSIDGFTSHKPPQPICSQNNRDRSRSGVVGKFGSWFRRTGHGVVAARRGRRDRRRDACGRAGNRPVPSGQQSPFAGPAGRAICGCARPSLWARGLGFSGDGPHRRHRRGPRPAVRQRSTSTDGCVTRRCWRSPAELEGHADNVAASLFGGIVATADGRAVRIPLAFDPAIVVWIPSFSTSTDESRTKMGRDVSLGDAVFNIGRTALLVAALAAGDTDALRSATQDRLHQDVRLASVEPSRAALQAALDGGAWCSWLSGSGPSVAAMCPFDDADELAARMPADGHTKVLRIDHGGAVIEADD